MADMQAVKRALAEALSLVDKADVAGLRARRGPAHTEPDADEAGGPPDGDADDCAECAAGTCTNPDHMKEDDAAGLEAMLEGK